MKNKFLPIILLLISFFWWLLWSYYFIYFLNWNLLFNNLNQQNITKNEKIIKNWTFTNITSLESNITNLVEKVWPSVVNVVISKDLALYKRDPFGFFQEQVWTVKKQIWWWSWFFITKEWLVLTNKHVVSEKNASYTVITNSWVEYEAKVLAVDPLTDLAIIKVNSNKKDFPVTPLINENDTINVWQFWVAIWNALAEFQNSVSLWVISWKNRSIQAWWEYNYSDLEKLNWLLQTDAAINPWNSWGPLINLDWKIMWVNTAIAWDAQWLWFSIQISQKKVDYMINSIEKYWSIKRPFLWINYWIIDENIATQLWLKSNYWAYIPKQNNSVIADSPANKAWIEQWDIILEIEWNKVTYEKSIQDIIQNKIPWDKVNLKILKENWVTKNIELTLWEY